MFFRLKKVILGKNSELQIKSSWNNIYLLITSQWSFVKILCQLVSEGVFDWRLYLQVSVWGDQIVKISELLKEKAKLKAWCLRSCLQGQLHQKPETRQWCTEIGALCTVGGYINWLQPLWKTVQWFLKQLKIELPYDPTILLLGLWPKISKVGS